MAARRQVWVERVITAALTGQMSGWARVDQMAALGNRVSFRAALDKVPAVEQTPEDRYLVGQRYPSLESVENGVEHGQRLSCGVDIRDRLQRRLCRQMLAERRPGSRWAQQLRQKRSPSRS
jgi:hypothetical protein